MRKSGRKTRPLKKAKNSGLAWGTVEAVGPDRLPCPAPACSKSYTREDHLREHLRKCHRWSQEDARKAVVPKRKGKCPDCSKELRNVAEHRRLNWPVLKAAKLKPKMIKIRRRKDGTYPHHSYTYPMPSILMPTNDQT